MKLGDLVYKGESFMDNALKAVSMTEDEYVVANYIILFGDENRRDLTGEPVRNFNTGKKNADGTKGEWFDKNTVYESQFTALGKIPIDWEHSESPEGKDLGLLGHVDWSTKAVDDIGVWVDRVLYRRNKYVDAIKELVDIGMIGNSVEPNFRKLKYAGNGYIESFPIVRDSLTVTPMEPRMLNENAIRALKSLGWAEQTPEGTTEGGDAVEPVKANTETIVIKNASQLDGGNEMTEEQTAPVDVEATVNAAVEQALKAYQARLEAQAPLKTAPVMVTEPKGHVIHDEADKPFANLAEQARAVKSAAKGWGADPRLGRLVLPDESAYKAPTGANVGIPSQGGFLVDPTLVSDIIKPVHEDGPFSSMARKLPVGGNSNYGWINGVDETSRATGSRWGGIRGYRLAEGADKTASKPKWRRINWELKKYAVLVYATDELLADAALFSAIVRQGSGEELVFMANDDILNGNGAGGPAGILTSGALVTVPKEIGQDAATIVTDNLDKMWQRFDPRSKKSSKNVAWFINSDVQPELDALVLTAGTGGLQPRYIGYGTDGVMNIRGKPVIETEFNATLGTVGDIVLGDMDEYLFWEKGGIQAAVSIHVNFVGDETVFRFVYRCDGQTTMNSPITPYKGTLTQSSFVALAERA